eukprot:489504_1
MSLQLNTVSTGYVRRITSLHQIVPLELVDLITLMAKNTLFQNYLPFQLSVVKFIKSPDGNVFYDKDLDISDQLLHEEWIKATFIPQILDDTHYIYSTNTGGHTLFDSSQHKFVTLALIFIRCNTKSFRSTDSFAKHNFVHSVNIYYDSFLDVYGHEVLNRNILQTLDNYLSTKVIFDALYDFFECFKRVSREYCINQTIDPLKYHKCTTLKLYVVSRTTTKMITMNHMYQYLEDCSIATCYTVYNRVTVYNDFEHDTIYHIKCLLQELAILTFNSNMYERYRYPEITVINEEILSSIAHQFVKLINEEDSHQETAPNQLITFEQFMNIGYYLLTIDRNCNCI